MQNDTETVLVEVSAADVLALSVIGKAAEQRLAKVRTIRKPTEAEMEELTNLLQHRATFKDFFNKASAAVIAGNE